MGVKERPILYKGAMVRAVDEDRKNQTRRLVIARMTEPRIPPLHMKPWVIGDELQVDDDGRPCWLGFHPEYPGEAKWFSCDYGKVGDRLWVRETLHKVAGTWVYAADQKPLQVAPANHLAAVAWAHHKDGLHCPSIHMPRWASRLTLEITDVRVEQLQQITDADARAEGVVDRASFAELWDQINKKRGYPWESNPYVWVISFKKLEAASA